MASQSPYPGLRPFKKEESHLFFGREDEIEEMISRLEERHFLAVVGTSGCGKSSIVSAGLLSELEGGYLLDGRHGLAYGHHEARTRSVS